MTNADKFKNIFGLYATELWSMPEKDFLKWLNSEAVNCSEFPNNSDTISRQAAIDAILHITNCKSVRELFEYNQEHHLTEMWSGGVNDAIDAVIGVESATDKNVGTKLSTNLAEVGTDLISRQQAIDALRKLREEDIEDYGCEIPEGFNQDHLDRATFAIKQLPPIQPKRGRWILDRSGAYCCSECMEPCAGYVMMKPRDKFCKMCGAKMEVNHESN